MSIIVNGTTLKDIYLGNTKLDKIICNGAEVYKRLAGYVWMRLYGSDTYPGYQVASDIVTAIRTGEQLGTSYNTNKSISIYTNNASTASNPSRTTPICFWDNKCWCINQSYSIAYTTDFSTWTAVSIHGAVPMGLFPSEDYLVIYAKYANNASSYTENESRGLVFKLDKNYSCSGNLHAGSYTASCNGVVFGNYCYKTIASSGDESSYTTLYKINISAGSNTHRTAVNSYYNNTVLIQGATNFLITYYSSTPVLYCTPNLSSDATESVTQSKTSSYNENFYNGIYFKNKYYIYTSYLENYKRTFYVYISADEGHSWTKYTTSIGDNYFPLNALCMMSYDEEKMYMPYKNGYAYSTDGINFTVVTLGEKEQIGYIVQNTL